MQKQKQTKEQKIAEFLATPVKKGEYMDVQGLSQRNPEQWKWARVIETEDKDGFLTLDNEGVRFTKHISECRRVPDFIGENPFRPAVSMQSYNVDIWQLLMRAGFDYSYTDGSEKDALIPKNELPGARDKGAPEVCYDPIVVDETGEEVEYQRGLVWTELQKQLLIMSIWNNVEIGKVVFRLRKFEWAMGRMKAGKTKGTAYADLVDGKQRIHAIISYIRGEFCDLNGIYWNDLSKMAKKRFVNYRNISYVELPSETTDREVLNTFLAINFSGVPMSMEHIQFVQSIKI